MTENQAASETTKKRTRKPKPCNPTVTITYGSQPMSAEAYQRFCDATAQISRARLPEQICDAVRKIVAFRGVKPSPGITAGDLSVTLGNGVEVSVEGRSRGKGIAIVRVDGQAVAHEFHGTFISGEWQKELARMYGETWKEEMSAPALAGCSRCNGSGFYSDEGDFIACGCTLREVSEFEA